MLLRALMIHLRNAAFAGALAVPSLAAAADMTLVLDRQDDAIEMYFTISAERVEDVFALPKEAFENDSGTVDFEPLRQGTYDIGDTLFANMDARLGGDDIIFEAMSLMVHPKANALPLQTPLDGMIAIAVCTVPAPAGPITLADLQLYAGFIAYADRPNQGMTFQLPNALDSPLTVEIRDYTSDKLTDVTYQTLVGPNPTLAIQSQTAPLRVQVIALLIAFAAGVGFVAVAWRYHRARKPSDALTA